MQRIILLGWLCCIYFVGMGQQLLILEESTQKPIEGALVFTASPLVYGMTAPNGIVHLATFKGVTEISVRCLGYQSSTVKVDFDNHRQPVVYLTPTLYNLDHVVVSATKWSQTSDNLPLKIIRITPEEAQFNNPQTAADLLGSSGKVFIQKSQQGGGSPMIRGFATNRLIYSVDGVRMNTAIFRSGNIQNVINLDPHAIASTEVLFGPGSVIYGSDAIGGVMSFQTLNPEISNDTSLLITGRASARYSSANNEKSSHAHLNFGGKKWAAVTSFSYWDFDDLKQGSHGPDEFLKTVYIDPSNDGNDQVIEQKNPLIQSPSAYAQLNMMQKVRWKPTDQLDLVYGLHYSNTSTYGRYDRHNRTRNGLPRYAEWNYGPQLWMMNHLQAKHQHINTFYDQATISLAKQKFEESRIDRTLFSTTRAIREEIVEAYSANIDFVKSFEMGHSFFYGFEYVKNDVTSKGIDENTATGEKTKGPSRYPDANWQSIGVYMADEWMISDQWTFNTGLRLNSFKIDAIFDTQFYPFPFTESQNKDVAVTGSVGTSYRPSDTWIITMNAATAFRAPNVDDLGKVFDSEPGAVTVPNSDLKSEYAYNLDMGMTKILGNHFKVDFNGYVTWLQNAMVRRDFILTGKDSILYDGVMSKVQAIQNAAEARICGIQASFELKANSGWSLLSDINYQKGTEEMDDGTLSPSRHVAPLFGVSRIRYKARQWMIELNSQYQGSLSNVQLAVEERSKKEIYALDDEGNAYAQGWYTVNLISNYKFNNRFSLIAGIENITDQRYRPYSSGISGAGRNYIISIAANF